MNSNHRDRTITIMLVDVKLTLGSAPVISTIFFLRCSQFKNIFLLLEIPIKIKPFLCGFPVILTLDAWWFLNLTSSM